VDEALQRLIAALDGYVPAQLPLIPQRGVRDVAARFDFAHPRALADVLDDVAALLREGTCHAAHPRHFGLFNPTTTLASVAADALVARFNPQLSVDAAAPFAAAAERHCLGVLASCLGFDPATLAMTFTTGGAESNHTAVVCALARALPGYVEDGVAGGVRPTVYASEEAHGSLQKAVQVTGVGRSSLRRVALDRACRMDVRALRRSIADDRAAGRLPVLLVATVGTTSAGAIDPLRSLAAVAREEGMWLHVDAAWGAIAALSPRTAHLLDGVTEADSVTWDAHKSLPVSMGAGMFFCRHPEVTRAAFASEAPYMMREPDGDDPYLTTMQWSRRFIGLKVLLTLATKGLAGVAADVDRQFALGDRLRAGLTAAGFEVVNDTALPVVCFTHPRIRSGAAPTRKVVQGMWRRGEAWVSDTRVGGRVPALRACVTNVDSREADVDGLVAAVRAAVTPPSEPPRSG
jgi:glutamate/tyrosine decarboxylase-like PLP-dependent enzyme